MVFADDASSDALAPRGVVRRGGQLLGGLEVAARLDVRERLRSRREGLVDVFAVDGPGEVERVRAGARRDEPAAIVPGRPGLADLEERLERELQRLRVTERDLDLQGVAEVGHGLAVVVQDDLDAVRLADVRRLGAEPDLHLEIALFAPFVRGRGGGREDGQRREDRDDAAERGGAPQ
jgi:hypothetical protein